MSNNHIVGLIESAPLASFSQSDLDTIRRHTNDCTDCRQAFEAAQISLLLLKEGTAETFEPSPFFHTRVLATLRERQAIGDQWGWSKVWRATGALASSMLATVAALAALTFVIPASPGSTRTQEMTTALNAYSAEEVLFGQGESDDQVSDDQILRTLYGAEDESAR